MTTMIEVPRPAAMRTYSDDQINLIKRTIAQGATDDELQLFIIQAQRTGLDPFSRQIYFSKSKSDGRVSTITSIDGFRLVAERSGKYAGQLGPFWCGADAIWREVWLPKEPPRAAKVGVLRTDFQQPCYAVARWESYSRQTGVWPRMPDLMLAKCAEALALRKAFPQELSGLYTNDEMAQAIPASDTDDPVLTLPSSAVEVEELPPDDKVPASEWVKSMEVVQTLVAGRALWSSFNRPETLARYSLDEQTEVFDAKERMKVRLGAA